jgi:hypothetical protein
MLTKGEDTMIKPRVKQCAKSYIEGTVTGMITQDYDLHWTNDFVKVGIEYVTKASELTPSARRLFDNLMKNNMDWHNKLINSTGFALSKSDIMAQYNLTTRRVEELMLELKTNGFIGKFESQNDSCWIVNPIIVSKSKSTNYAILNLFSEYYIKSIGKLVCREYDLVTINMINYKPKEEITHE